MATKDIPKIEVQERDRLGSRYAIRLREQGRLPAVVYGHKQPPQHVSVDRKQINHLLHEGEHVLEMQMDSGTQPCLIKDVQWDHLGSQVVHIDLERIDLTERVTVEVDIVLTGDAVGLKEAGAILEHPLTVIEIECLATQIPDEISVDVSDLNAGDAVTVADLKLPDGVTTPLDDDTVVATISIVEEEEVEEEPTEAGAEPEVIGGADKDSEDEAGGDAAAPGKAGGKEKKG